ncbi:MULTISPECIES: hypothetical protein [Pandoraea]|uniref:hypothetical protein n=1 Tax=Pandoraea TaxID=93217 RepID=UPI001F5CF791|nr:MULTISPECIES: hypothetical protein [Pandoraea]MCI3203928.1 hypothetical protein [Pandoraea sp. LA3]MDN4581954.1 hypothetical protein [Pandoraea capi]
MQWLGVQQGFGSTTDLYERVAIYRGVANEGDEAAKAQHVAQRMPDFQGASQRSPTSDNSFATLAAFGALDGPRARIVARRDALDADGVSGFSDDFAGARRRSPTRSPMIVETLRREILTPEFLHPSGAAQARAGRGERVVACESVSKVPALPGHWCGAMVPDASRDVGCWQFDPTFTFRERVDYVPQAMPAVLTTAVASATASRMGLPGEFPIVCHRAFHCDAGHLMATTEWRDACHSGRTLRQRCDDLGAFPYPACVPVNFRGDAEGVVVMPVDITPNPGEPPVTLLFSSPYGRYLSIDGSVHAMTFVGDASYTFAMPSTDVPTGPVVAHRVMPGSDADVLFRLADQIMITKMEIDTFVSCTIGPGWAHGPMSADGSTLNLKWVQHDAGLMRLFSEAGEELTQQLGTMLDVLHDPDARLIRLYRNFVPDDTHADVNARHLVALHHDKLMQDRASLEATFRRLTEMAAIVDFQLPNGAPFDGTLLGMATGSLAQATIRSRYDVPVILVARDLVQGIFMAQGTHAANVAGHHFADVLFHECGHAAAQWEDAAIPQPWARRPAHEFRHVYLREEWRGGTMDLAPLMATLRESTPGSVVNLASFNQLMRMLLPALDAGLAPDVFPGLLDGSSARYSYEYLVAMLSEPHDRARFDADFLDFLDELAQRGRNLSRQEHS